MQLMYSFYWKWK